MHHGEHRGKKTHVNKAKNTEIGEKEGEISESRG